MLFDIFDEFLLNNETLQNVLLAIMVAGVIIVFAIKAEITQVEIIILMVCLAFMYLYAQGIVGTLIFTIAMLMLFTTMFFVMGFHKEETA